MAVAVLVVCPTWGPPADAPPFIAARHEGLIAGLGDLLAPFGGRVAGTDGEVVLAVVPDAVSALDVALDLHRRGKESCVGLGWGPEGLTTAEAARARRLAWRAPPGVRCTTAFREALGGVPAGIGLWSVPQDLALRLGFSALEVSDHRTTRAPEPGLG